MSSVVVVDGMAEIRQVIELWLRELGCVVICVDSGRKAVRILSRVQVDIVITDVLMPEVDGLELITGLRRTQPSARIIAMTGGGVYLDSAHCLRLAKGLGAVATLRKPFRRDQFLETVSPFLMSRDSAATA